MTTPEFGPPQEERVPVTIRKSLTDRLHMFREYIAANDDYDTAVKEYALGRLVLEDLIDDAFESYLESVVHTFLDIESPDTEM